MMGTGMALSALLVFGTSAGGSALMPPLMLTNVQSGACSLRARLTATYGNGELTPTKASMPLLTRRAMTTAIISGAP